MNAFSRTLADGASILIQNGTPVGGPETVKLAPGDAIAVTAAVPAPSPVPTPPPPSVSSGIWIGRADIMSRPMVGAAWDSVKAQSGTGTDADVSNLDSTHDVRTLGLALYAVRTGDSTARAHAIAALASAIGTEKTGGTDTQTRPRWLNAARNLGSYVCAADILDIRFGPIFDWLKALATTETLQNNNDASKQETLKQNAWASGSNASAEAGFVYSALCAYLGDKAGLDWNWMAFRRYAGDRMSAWKITSNDMSWQATSDIVGIQNKGAIKAGINIDGAISNDMSRGGSVSATPGYTSYPWVGLEGAVPAAVILARAGYPAWSIADEALKRAAQYLHRLLPQNPAWYDGSRARDVKYLLNLAYDLGYPGDRPVGVVRTTGFEDFTHTTKATIGR